MPLDLTKPIRTVGGKPARIVCTDRKSYNGESLLVLVDEGDFEDPVSYLPDGRYSHGGPEDEAIVNTPKKFSCWVIILANRKDGMISSISYETEQQALAAARRSSEANADWRVLAGPKLVELEEGEGLPEKSES